MQNFLIISVTKTFCVKGCGIYYTTEGSYPHYCQLPLKEAVMCDESSLFSVSASLAACIIENSHHPQQQHGLIINTTSL
jgi:hypothetical protein